MLIVSLNPVNYWFISRLLATGSPRTFFMANGHLKGGPQE